VPIFDKFFGRTVGEGAGVAIGDATAKVVEPVLQDLANAAWENNAHMPIEPAAAAEARARETLTGLPGIDLGGVDPAHEALYGGIRKARFDVLTELARRMPDLGSLLRLRRRAVVRGDDAGIDQFNFRKALRHSGLPREHVDGLTKLLNTWLSPADVANAVQQGFLPGDDLLPPPETGGPPFEPPTERVNLDPSDEAYDAGIDKDRLRVLAQLSGNPPGPMELLEMWRRGIITETAVERGVREGRTKTKWIPALKALKAQLLSPAVLVNRRLRAWDDATTFHNRMALHGFNATQADDWYESAGRPISPTQAYTAWARDAPHVVQPGFSPPGPDFSYDDFERAIRQSDIRPEWAPILWHNRFAYPSLFQLRRAVQDGGISRERALTILRYERYEATDATALVNSWLRDTGATGRGLTAADLATEYEGGWITRDELVTELVGLGYTNAAAAEKAQAVDARMDRTYRTAARNRIQHRFDIFQADEAETRAALAQIGIGAAAQDRLIIVWELIRATKARELTPAQVVKAWKKGIYSRAEAVDELEGRGYSLGDANTLLDEA
jgi:hypothetical protein